MLIYKNHFFFLLQYPKKPKKHPRILSILPLHCIKWSNIMFILLYKHLSSFDASCYTQFCVQATQFCVQALPYFQGKELFMRFQKAL